MLAKSIQMFTLQDLWSALLISPSTYGYSTPPQSLTQLRGGPLWILKYINIFNYKWIFLLSYAIAAFLYIKYTVLCFFVHFKIKNMQTCVWKFNFFNASLGAIYKYAFVFIIFVVGRYFVSISILLYQAIIFFKSTNVHLYFLQVFYKFILK